MPRSSLFPIHCWIQVIFTFTELRVHYRIDPGKFPLYLKELEVRYNYRNDNLFNVVIRQLKL